jgi:hypothetical protein
MARRKPIKVERKFAAAAVIGERILAIERDWLGDKNRRIVMSMEWLANVYQAAEDLPNCKQKLQEILKWRNAQQGEEHWGNKACQAKATGHTTIDSAAVKAGRGGKSAQQ